jgi:hypothetical protein
LTWAKACTPPGLDEAGTNAEEAKVSGKTQMNHADWAVSGSHGEAGEGADPREHVGEGEYERERRPEVVDRLAGTESEREPHEHHDHQGQDVHRDVGGGASHEDGRAGDREGAEAVDDAGLEVLGQPEACVVSAPKIAVWTMIPGRRKST